jgi:hypothetical protein
MIGDLLGGESVADDGILDVGAFLAPEARRRREAPPVVYERYLCGGPRQLNINDR